MKMNFFVFLTLIFTFVGQAQQSSYAGEEQRSIKSLSDKEIEQYRSGAGMGLAKAAELNHYPGPKHLLELADTLNISPEQKKDLERIFGEMSNAAIAVGQQIIEKEKILNTEFGNGTITLSLLEQMTKSIGELQAKLRFIHLRAHIAAKDMMTQHQLHLYDVLRGYNSNTKIHRQGH